MTDEEAKQIEEVKTGSEQNQNSAEGKPHPPESSATEEMTDTQKVKAMVFGNNG